MRERGDELVEVAHDRRREPERRLVEQQQLRSRDERPSEGEHLLLTAGQGSRLLVPPALESREVAGDVLAVALRLAPVAAVIRADEEVLPDGQLGVDLPALGDVGDAEPRDRLGGLAADVLAPEDDAARPPDGARDRAQRRRLAGAVRSEDGDRLAVVHRQRDAVERLDAAVTGIDTVQLQQRRHLAGFALGAEIRLDDGGVGTHCIRAARGQWSSRSRARARSRTRA